MAHIALSLLQVQDGISRKTFDALQPCISSWLMSDDEVDTYTRESLPEYDCILAGILSKVFLCNAQTAAGT